MGRASAREAVWTCYERLVRLLIALAFLLAGCSGSPDETSPRPARHPRARGEPVAAPDPARAPAVSDSDVPSLPPSTMPAPARLVAIGDVHGDLDAFESALRAGGAIDAGGHWSGGELVVVQTGDLLDRGDQEEDILALALRLETEAQAAGGRFVALNGNHELMNAQGDFRYVTPGGYADFDDLASEAEGPLYEGLPAGVRGRVYAFHPGGPYARVFATRLTIAVVGDTLFVHGGALARYVQGEGIDAINRGARAFFLGAARLTPALEASDGPVWYRGFATEGDEATCARLAEALAAAHVRRMVIGHTKQRGGITSACEQRVFRIDVGLARIYDGPIEVLEITGDTTRVLHGVR